jgi:hypothetical protein
MDDFASRVLRESSTPTGVRFSVRAALAALTDLRGWYRHRTLAALHRRQRALLPHCPSCRAPVTALELASAPGGGLHVTVTCHGVTRVHAVPQSFVNEFGEDSRFPALLAERLGLRYAG